MTRSEAKQIVEKEVKKAFSEIRFHEAMSDILGVSDNVQKTETRAPESGEHYLHGIL